MGRVKSASNLRRVLPAAQPPKSHHHPFGQWAAHPPTGPRHPEIPASTRDTAAAPNVPVTSTTRQAATRPVPDGGQSVPLTPNSGLKRGYGGTPRPATEGA